MANIRGGGPEDFERVTGLPASDLVISPMPIGIPWHITVTSADGKRVVWPPARSMRCERLLPHMPPGPAHLLSAEVPRRAVPCRAARRGGGAPNRRPSGRLDIADRAGAEELFLMTNLYPATTGLHADPRHPA